MKLRSDLTPETVTPSPPTDETSPTTAPTGPPHGWLLSFTYLLHIYLVNDVIGADGNTCSASNTRPQAVIYVDIGRSGTLLVHEAGHALGFSLPRDGHWEEMTGLDPANVMVSGYAPRDRG